MTVLSIDVFLLRAQILGSCTDSETQFAHCARTHWQGRQNCRGTSTPTRSRRQILRQKSARFVCTSSVSVQTLSDDRANCLTFLTGFPLVSFRAALPSQCWLRKPPRFSVPSWSVLLKTCLDIGSLAKTRLAPTTNPPNATLRSPCQFYANVYLASKVLYH